MFIGACPFKGAQHRSKRIKEGKDKMNDEKPGLTKHVPLENGHFQICFDSEYKLKRVVGYFILLPIFTI